jgi:hypothetical protein
MPCAAAVAAIAVPGRGLWQLLVVLMQETRSWQCVPCCQRMPWAAAVAAVALLSSGNVMSWQLLVVLG